MYTNSIKGLRMVLRGWLRAAKVLDISRISSEEDFVNKNHYKTMNFRATHNLYNERMP